ncbi:DUF4255 domain-containing protein [Tenacibaculum sp. M341]|uniref:DUF4255 domain-containing protein n=1 Tax=Tenacibaculum sp. M341 TaxID=2530339 RepID=UPI00104EFA9D|nr:DUF4255 domain-containing protein [Tenacibaculum sp. M341]TCI93201.1 DUF4255 domain-containing protein [Tenacibaculum sp. M341]
MIYNVLNIIKKEASNYLGDESLVVLDNLVKIDQGSGSLKDKVILSMLSIEEEATLKNTANHKIVNGKKVFTGTPAYLNMYIMFAANRTNYEMALQDIESVVEFFQNKTFFTPSNTPDHGTNLTEFKFHIDLSSLRFEQLSYVWGVMGGKIMPSAFYKVSIVEVVKENVKQKTPIITGIEGALNQQ